MSIFSIFLLLSIIIYAANYEKLSANPPYFIRRCLALLIDAFLLYKIIYFRSIELIPIAFFGLIPSYKNDLYIIVAESLIKIFLYLTIFTISPFKGTIGKRLFNIQIASTTDEEIKLHQVLLRSFIQIISVTILVPLIYVPMIMGPKHLFYLSGLLAPVFIYLQLILTYIPIIFSKCNQTIHDKASKTRIVINKGSNKFITIILWIFLATYLATYIYLLFN